MKSYYQKNLPIYLLITSVILFVWHKVLNQSFLGEGYYYFLSKLYIFKDFSIPNLSDYDNFAKIFFQLLSPILTDNINAYFAVELIFVIIFFFSFYYVLEKITSSKYVAFTSTIFLSTNYLALFEYLGAGNYQRFIQRFPNLIPLVFAFYFLWKFVNYKKIKHLFISYILYSFSIVMGHFSALMLPLFVIYPLITHVNLKRILISLMFIIATTLLTQFSMQKPSYTIFDFLNNEPDILKRIIYQIPLITFPIDLIKHFSLKSLLIPSLLIYVSGGILVYKRLPKLTTLYITFFISMIGVMFTYLYTDSRLNVLNGYGEDRYYLLSSLFAVTLWSMTLKALFIRKGIILNIITTVVLCTFISYNTQAIWKHIDKLKPESEMNKVLINYFKSNKENFATNSVVIAPYYVSFISPLITDITLKCKGLEFVLPFDGWEEKYWSMKNNVFVFDYDSGRLLDLTDKYRSRKNIKSYEIPE